MPKLKLTDGIVEGEASRATDHYLWDSELTRFGVKITPAGSRIYLVQYRAKAAPGEKPKLRRIKIGEHDGSLWNVTKARAAARKLLAPVDLGGDTFADHQEERRARLRAEEAERAAEAAAAIKAEAAAKAEEMRRRDSFAAVAERYIRHHVDAQRSGAETARLLRREAVIAWSDHHIAEIRRSDVADLLDTIKVRSPSVSRATYAALRGLFGWCLDRDLIQSSPCDRIRAPARPEARDRVLTAEELQAIWKASDALSGRFGPIFKLLMLTGQREGEVANMAWAEVDLEAAIWRIPKERAKNGKAHEVDLSPQAKAVLQSLERAGALVFPGKVAPTRKGEHNQVAEAKGVVGFSATKRRLDEEIEAICQGDNAKAPKPVRPWRIHDLRRTAATGMAGMGFPPHVVERVINHISGAQGGLVGVYQRHEYREERKAALKAWGAHVEAVVQGVEPASNVRALRAKAPRGPLARIPNR